MKIRSVLTVCTALFCLLVVNPANAAFRYIDLKGATITNTKGTCLHYQGLKDVIIFNGTIGPCKGHGVHIEDSENVFLQQVKIRDVTDAGVYIDSVSQFRMRWSTVRNSASAVVAISSSGIRIDCNTFVDSRGPGGQHVQFNKVTGARNWCRCNVGRNTAGRTDPEDAISMYKSSGTAASPIDIWNNLIVGGGPSRSGGGIMLGDAGGRYQTARSNILVDPGQYGVAVAGGQDMRITGNRIYARRQAFTNVGIYVWNQAGGNCRSILVQSNSVNWTASNGRKNPFWDGENCGVISGIASNLFNAAIGPEIQYIRAPECGCVYAGRPR